ncbi:glycosyltransferase [Paenibacillus sp. NPDC056579]|uniref:glycosyltransferase n=1 Tax=Paenibacillus sp. NPDC056579 TaxID=3345871 RepID=UPI00368C36CA
MKTSIIIATYNKMEYTQQCIQSIREYTEYGNYEIIVVDNHSTDETVNWLRQQNDIRLIVNDENLGFPKACNQGIEIANGENILLLNNDTIVTHNWLDNLLSCLYSCDDIGAVGSVTNHCSYYQAIPVSYQTIEEMHQFALDYNQSNPLLWEERLKLIGYCLLIKKSVVDKIGLLDEQFTPGNYEDDDYSLQIRKAGYKLILCKDTFIHHFGSASFRENKAYNDLMYTNRLKFLKKWGFDPDSAQVINQEIAQLIRKPLHQPLRILDIGCLCGGTLLQIKDHYRNAEIYGIEEKEPNRLSASLFAQTMSNIHELALKFNEHFFDVIIITNPKDNHSEQIRNLLAYLKPDGVLLAQMPNLLYYRVVQEMIQGKINREQLTYYKASEIEPIFKELGMSQVEIKAAIGYIPSRDDAFIKQIAEISGVGIEEPYRIHSFYVRSSRLSNKDSIDNLVESILVEEKIEDSIQLLLQYQVDEVISTIVERTNEAVPVLNVLGILGYEQKQYDWSQQLLNKAFEIAPDNEDTYYNLAVVLHAKGEHQLAYDWLQFIKNRDYDVLQFEEELQKLLAKERFIKDELKYLLRRIEFDIEVQPSTDIVIEWLQEDTDNNIDLMWFNLEQYVISKAKVLNALANTSYGQGQYEMVLTLLQKAIEYEPNDAETLYNLALVLYQFGETDLAHRYLNQISTNDENLIAAARELEESLLI